MIRLIVAAAALFAAYKIGEQRASLSQFDFFITNTSSPGQGQPIITSYAIVDNTGMISFTTDMNQATVFNYFDALNLRSLLRKYAPPMDLQLETVSTYLTAQQA